MFAIEVLGEDGVGGVLHPIGPSPTYLGRAPQNDLVVLDPTVSGRHLALWVADGRVFVEDLGSRNGTHVLGKRIAGVLRVMPGAEILAGEGTRLRVLRTPSTSPTGPRVSLAVEDVASNVRYPVRGDRFRIGGHPNDDLVIRGMAARAATLLFHTNGEIWLGVDDEEVEVSLGDVFTIGERSLIVREVEAEVSETIEREETHYPYVLTADLSAAGGPWAEIEHANTGERHRVTGETRAVLLYLLACQHKGDVARGLAPEEAGWCDDREVMVGLWGREGGESPLSKLNVLVCRVRQELREAGFDPWCLEKRRGATRVRVRDARADPLIRPTPPA